ncbi:MAG TPA: YhjD/YihY/BrkB family envelope integrity protein [Ornithinibacter sp.]|nr:YhjD/YihY/BrkB family envelope integrity protein [Ornithinibacter sp.]
MESAPFLLPIPGDLVDPPARDLPDRVRLLQARAGPVGSGVTLGTRITLRFTHSRATLLAAGTTYYLFLALFSVLTLAYGLTAALGAERLSDYVTEAVSAAFPGLVGGSGINPEDLRSIGQTTSIISAVGLLYGATGAVLAASRSLHTIYGAPPNTRNFVVVRLWALGWLILLAPLVLLSFVGASFTANLSDRLLGALGLQWDGPRLLLGLVALVVTMGVNFLVMYLLLGRLGGIRPTRVPRLVGAALGTVAIEVLKQVMALLVTLVIAKPQYGALAAPIGIMFVLYLQSMALYAAASVTAALAELGVGDAESARGSRVG